MHSFSIKKKPVQSMFVTGKSTSAAGLPRDSLSLGKKKK
jgi:hypothetical protein